MIRHPSVQTRLSDKSIVINFSFQVSMQSAGLHPVDFQMRIGYAVIPYHHPPCGMVNKDRTIPSGGVCLFHPVMKIVVFQVGGIRPAQPEGTGVFNIAVAINIDGLGCPECTYDGPDTIMINQAASS
jgi:hypothetical protein